MNKITTHVCSWQGAELLKQFIPKFLSSLTEDVNLKIVLNEADDESVNLCRDYKIDFVAVDKNYGTLAVDFLIPFTDAEYVMQSNTDMYFPNGWDTAMLRAIENNGNCSVCLSRVEPYGANSLVITEDLGSFADPDTYQRFIDNFTAGRYKLPNKISYAHPLLTKFSDLKAVNGYSDNLDMGWFPGYSLDDWFAHRLYHLHNKNFKFIALGDWFVYHGISVTNNKLNPNIKARNGIEYFIKKTGHHWLELKKEIREFNEIKIN